MLGPSGFRRTIAASIRRLLGDRRGNVAIISALVLPALMGSFGLGTEVASWYANQRTMQNAADSAALAAATNASTNYGVEAKAVTAHYGYTDGQNGVVVTTSNGAACPGGGSTCYSVTITKSLPLILAQFVGYSGDTTLAGAPAKRIRATAIAVQGTVQRPYCLVALGQMGTTIQSNGAPNTNLSGCNVMANGNATCNGHNLGADFGDAHGTNSGCGVTQDSNMPVLPDPYSSLAPNIPADTCGGAYPQEPVRRNDPALPVSNQFSGSYSWGSVQKVCGDMQLTGPMTISNSGASTVLVIYNGSLDTNGYTLQTASGSALTIIFAGGNAYNHAPIGGGTLDFNAPTSGTWSGVAIYQDPALTSGVNISAAGNSPTWDITGLVYLPHASVTFSGAVNKGSNGSACFAMVVNDITINGTGSILAHGGCGQAGLTLPTNSVPGRGQLVS
jgi:Flp pilus assembly protein TadG